MSSSPAVVTASLDARTNDVSADRKGVPVVQSATEGIAAATLPSLLPQTVGVMGNRNERSTEKQQ